MVTPLRFSWRQAPTEAQKKFNECGGFADWVEGRVTKNCLIVTALDANGAPAVEVAYHHDGPASYRPDATLRRAMQQLAAMRRDLAPSHPTPVRVDHWAFPEKRTMPLPGETVGPEHVNGGCTHRGGVIHCFRHEDYPKVWLHEAAHAFGIDMWTPQGTPEERALRRLLPGQGPLLPGEAWAELVAEAYSTACLSNAPIGSTKWLRAWAAETEHAFAQAGALARHMGHTRAQDLFTGRRPWRERTNALAYYVLRAALMPQHTEWARVTSPAILAPFLLERLRHPQFSMQLQRGMDAPPKPDRNLRMTLQS